MDGPRDYHTKQSKSNKEKDITYIWTLKMIQMHLFTKLKQNHRHKKQFYDYQMWGLGIN